MELFTATGSTASSGFIWIVLIVMIAVMYFFTIRPQKKEEAKQKDMLNATEVGDEIITTGGIVGRVVSVSASDETVLLETGSDRTKIRIAKWAIRANTTRQQAEASRQKAAVEAKQKEKEAKKAGKK